MGRGDHQGQQASSPGFLFGQRRPRPIDDSRLLRMADAKRRRQHDKRRRQRQQLLRVAEEHLIAGDGQPLTDHLAQELPPETIADEHQDLLELTYRLKKQFPSPFVSVTTRSAVIDTTTIGALQSLRQRALEYDLPGSACYELDMVLDSQLSVLVRRQLGTRLEQRREAIGPLPRIWSVANDDYYHLRPLDSSNKTLCGRRFIACADLRPAPARGEISPLGHGVDCQDCFSLWASGAEMKMAEPDVWHQQWLDDATHDFNIMFQSSFFAFNENSPDPKLTADEISDALLAWRLGRIKNNFPPSQLQRLAPLEDG